MAARRKPKPIAVDADYGPPERHQHGGVDLVTVKLGSGNAVTKAAKVRFEHVLDRYLSRCVIDDRQHEAGMKVRGYWEQATLLPQKLAMNMDRGHGGHDTGDTPLAVVNASSRLQQVRDLLTQDEYALLIAVCGHGEYATNVAPRNRALDMMRDGLNAARLAWRM